MKCLACGREMMKAEADFVCLNLVCDYVEEIEKMEVRVPAHCLENVSTTIAWAIK